MAIKELEREQVFYIDNIPCFPFNFFNSDLISFSGKKVADQMMTYDIETTTLNKDLNIMYIWMLCFNGEFVVYGRTWEDYKKLNDILQEKSKGLKVICYVHNLSYEFQYLRGIFDFTEDNVFCMKSRKVARAKMGNIEYRCSYYLSNKSLDSWCKELDVPHKKLSGQEFDYSKVRYPNTPLTIKEMQYAMVDVIGLYECIVRTLEMYEDTYLTIPMTSTGFVRRDSKEALKKKKRSVHKILPDLEQVKLLISLFRGGDTHCNRYYSGVILENVHSYDAQSSYPNGMMTELFPMSAFSKVDNLSLIKFKQISKKTNLAWFATVKLKNVRLKHDWWGFPYLSYAKCKNIVKMQKDNGRILSACQLTTSITDVDWKIIEEEYIFELEEVTVMYTSRYGYLPEEIKTVIRKYYKIKTELKGVPGQEVEYMKSKNKINSIYGMFVQSPLKKNIKYRDFEYIEEEEPDQETLDRYYKRAFLSYAWGVWTTAWSRYRLHEALWIVGEDGVYCDTDSVKFVGDHDFSVLNSERIEKSKRWKAYATDRKGKVQYMGIMDYEGTYDTFVSLGAKKYAYVKDGALGITIAGVSKKLGALELEEKGGLEALQEGFVFSADQQEWRYNDEPTHTLNLDGIDVIVTPNISAVPSTYEVHLTSDYRLLLDEILRQKMYRDVLT